MRAVVAFVALGFASAALRSTAIEPRTFALAAGYAAALTIVAAVVPWRRLAPAALLVLPLGADVLVALLRHAQGGSQSGYAPLLLLPVIWAAFVTGGRGVLLLVGATAVTLLAPIAFVGAPRYPVSSLRQAVLTTIVAAAVVVTERGAAGARRRTEEALGRAELLDRLVCTQTAIAMSALRLEDVLETVVANALELTGADAAVVGLPEGGELVYRAVAGTAVPRAGDRLPIAGSLPGRCLATLEPVVVTDSDADDRVDREACRRVGARSLVVVPLVHSGAAAGVLEVYSATPFAVGEHEARVLALLGNVIGTALVRAELLATLSEHAQTDPLTGLANRRSWNDQLERALAQAARSGETVSVALCDIDELKAVNDREGHAAGDEVIRQVAECLGRGARAADLLARIGGDEFVLLLPGADMDGAVEVLNRLTQPLPAGRSVSVGIAEWDGRETGAELVARADIRMYEQKRRAQATARAAG